MYFRYLPIALIILSISVAGCQRPRPLIEDKPMGGLITGKSGEYVIYSDKKRKRNRRR